MTDRRKQQLADWLKDTSVAPNGGLDMVSGDASFRRYFRYPHADHWLIAVDAPPPQESLQPFMAIAACYQSQGINAPRVHAFNEDAGFMVLDDFGNRLLFEGLVDEAQALSLYQQALAQLPAIMRATQTELGELPHYDRALLERELALFHDWLMTEHLGLQLNVAQRQVWQAGCEYLIESALQQPQVGVHRDYHSRNLMLCDDQGALGGDALGVIDFQDAVVGPITYDAVSLLRDCYVKWPQQLVADGVAFLHQRLQTEGLLSEDTDLTEFTVWFDLMGMQRHLKAAGIFARLWHRDSKPGYMADVPRTLSYILEVSANYPKLAEFHQLIRLVEERLEQATDSTRSGV